jgi:tripartite-type tricarboxylate transporter receptor subunit TctC
VIVVSTIKTLLSAACALAVGATAAQAQSAQGFPNRPITLINVFAAGGPSDIHLRALANKAKDVFGVPVVVENKLGGAGTVGPAVMAATAKPDGYTISYVGAGIFTVPNLQKVAFDPAKDFTYIIGLAGYNIITAVKTDARWKTWAEVAAEAQANPLKITYSTPGVGSATHLAFESVAHPLGLKFRHVPFRGASEQVAAMMGGHIDLTAVGGNIFPLIDAGEARPVLWLADEPSARYPDVPALKQLGIRSEVDLNFPYGLAGPKGMDPAIVKTLHDGFKKAMDTPEHEAVLKQLDQPSRYMSTAEYGAFAMQQIQAYKVAMERLGIQRKE